MRSSLLCPVYRKWLQLHPEQARLKRQELKQRALESRRRGNYSKAVTLYKLVWEIAQSVLFSLREPQSKESLHYQDLIVFAASAKSLWQCSHYQDAHQQVAEGSDADILHNTQQQLNALMPLYAAEPELLTTIHQLQEWLQHSRYSQTVSLLH